MPEGRLQRTRQNYNAEMPTQWPGFVPDGDWFIRQPLTEAEARKGVESIRVGLRRPRRAYTDEPLRLRMSGDWF